MEVYKRKIYLEPLFDRRAGITYGTMTASSISVNFLLTQSISNIGMSTDAEVSDEEPIPFTIDGGPNIDNPLTKRLTDSGITFNFMYSAGTLSIPQTVSDFYAEGNKITAYTSSRISELKKYDSLTPYSVGFNFNKNEYYDYHGDLINGVSKIFDLSSVGYSGYSMDAEDDVNLGTVNQTTGLLFSDTDEIAEVFDDEISMSIPARISKLVYKAQGWNETNISLSGNMKEEKFLSIVSPPEVESEIFIERSGNSILESHFRLSEIKSLEHLENYNNGAYYKLEKQIL